MAQSLKKSDKSKGKRPIRRQKAEKGVFATVVIDGVKVKLLKPVGRGTIPAAKIRKAVAAVRKAQAEKAVGASGE